MHSVSHSLAITATSEPKLSKTNAILVQWHNARLHTDIEFIYSKLNQYNIGVTVKGNFVDRNTEPHLLIKLNKIKTILRNDYINFTKGDPTALTGKALSVAFDHLLLAIIKSTSEIMEKFPEEKIVANVLDKYIQ